MAKYFTLVLVVLLSLSANSQKVDSVKAKEDSIAYVTKILSLSDIDRIMLTKKSVVSVADWETFWKVINGALLPDAIKEYQSQRAKPKK